jgi:hypothetical protein
MVITCNVILWRFQLEHVAAMKISKEHILSEIKRTATANGGIALGRRKFELETGIREPDWNKHWIRWGDAIQDAGLARNDKQQALPDDFILEKLTFFIRELGHFPVVLEFKMKAREASDFPNVKTYSRYGPKSSIAKRVIEHCEHIGGFADVIELCRPIAVDAVVQNQEQVEAPPPSDVGYVYMWKSGTRYKIGKTDSLESRYKGLSAQVSHELIQVHAILTDDPFGIEAYWHKRFKDKRRYNEWFELSATDVAAFKRRKFM